MLKITKHNSQISNKSIDRKGKRKYSEHVPKPSLSSYCYVHIR